MNRTSTGCREALRNVVTQGAVFFFRDGEPHLSSPIELDITTIETIATGRRAIIEAWQERSAIREFDGGLKRPEAEQLACQDITEMARNGLLG